MPIINNSVMIDGRSCSQSILGVVAAALDEIESCLSRRNAVIAISGAGILSFNRLSTHEDAIRFTICVKNVLIVSDSITATSAARPQPGPGNVRFRFRVRGNEPPARRGPPHRCHEIKWPREELVSDGFYCIWATGDVQSHSVKVPTT